MEPDCGEVDDAAIEGVPKAIALAAVKVKLMTSGIQPGPAPAMLSQRITVRC